CWIVDRRKTGEIAGPHGVRGHGDNRVAALSTLNSVFPVDHEEDLILNHRTAGLPAEVVQLELRHSAGPETIAGSIERCVLKVLVAHTMPGIASAFADLV